MFMDNAMINQFFEQHFWFFILAALWTIPWKGVALWKAAQAKQMGWFVAILILNTLAILEITYIFYFSKAEHPALEHDVEK